jgi:hypothetical protein
MTDGWGEAYVQLGLRIERAFPGFVDSYYGPPGLKAQLDAEPVLAPADLVRAAMRLGDSLSDQGYPARRTAYLARQVRGMETVCRVLDGQRFSLEDEVERYFDIHPVRIPESQFEQGLALYEAALPGPGPLAERVEAWRQHHELPHDKSGLLPAMLRDALAETRRRATRFIELPSNEAVEVQTVTGQPWGAYNWFLGAGRSRIEFNTDLPTDVSRLLDLMAHEGYPGHHTEHTLKEALLYQQVGYLEHAILLINTPECVISEGIASLAGDMLFGPGEAHVWLAQHVYPQVGIESDAATMTQTQQAASLLAGVRGNAVFMLHVDGRSDDDVARYLIQYSLISEARARKALEFLKSPLWRAYTFTYLYGKQLLQPLLQGEDRLTVFRRLLTEQVYPSLLVEWAG